MEITQQILADAWLRTAARHALLDGVGLPPVTLSEDELEEWVWRAEETGDGGLFLLLGPGSSRPPPLNRRPHAGSIRPSMSATSPRLPPCSRIAASATRYSTRSRSRVAKTSR
ncbi:hypothetical protein ACFYQ5_13910 [Streptomyces sp. NPDC005794]|uniref:hypothetical protein n=1 Tax=Streptomyces sp. NPDC005794 TaxID=3364733 RepID=UPI0036C81A31